MSGVPWCSGSSSPGSLHRDSLQGWLAPPPPTWTSFLLCQMGWWGRQSSSPQAKAGGARVQLRMEESRLETLANPWSESRDCTGGPQRLPSSPQSELGRRLADWGLPQTSQHEPEEPNTLSPEGRASCDYGPTPASRVSVQPSPPAQKLDSRVPWWVQQGQRVYGRRGPLVLSPLGIQKALRPET